MMNIPYTAIHFATYESSKKYFGNGDDETLIMQLGAGGIAGGLAAAATTPMDVVKTRLQLEGLGSATKYNTMSMVRLRKVISCRKKYLCSLFAYPLKLYLGLFPLHRDNILQ